MLSNHLPVSCGRHDAIGADAVFHSLGAGISFCPMSVLVDADWVFEQNSSPATARTAS